MQSGKYGEVRRAWESQGLQVNRLKRVRYGNILLPVDLSSGKSVEIGGRLLSELYDLVDYSALKIKIKEAQENENSHCELENERVKTSTGI